MKNQHHICPWQHGPSLSMRLRLLVHNPRRMFCQYIKNGMTVIDVGCGMGFFTIPISGMVGSDGRVIAVDLQPEMLEGLKKRSVKKECFNIVLHQCKVDTLSLEEWTGKVDFALVFWMLHEVQDSRRLMSDIFSVLSDNGKLLFAEPKGHVSAEEFKGSLDLIKKAGFSIVETPKVAFSRAILLKKCGKES